MSRTCHFAAEILTLLLENKETDEGKVGALLPHDVNSGKGGVWHVRKHDALVIVHNNHL